MGIEQLFTLEFYSDSPYILATGGTGGQIGVWDTEENGVIAERFVKAGN